MIFLQHLQDAELHVGAGEGLAVLKLHPFPQFEGDGLPVRANLPGLCEAWLRLEVEVVLEETLIDLRGDLPDRTGRAEIGGKRWRLGLYYHDERATLLWCRRPSLPAAQRITCECAGSDDEAPPIQAENVHLACRIRYRIIAVEACFPHDRRSLSSWSLCFGMSCGLHCLHSAGNVEAATIRCDLDTTLYTKIQFAPAVNPTSKAKIVSATPSVRATMHFERCAA